MANDLFAIINHLNTKSDFDRDGAISGINPFLVNRAMSMGMDTVFYANEMNNNYDYDKEMVYDFYLYALPKAKRFNPWAKKVIENEELIKLIMDKYKVASDTATNYMSVMSDEEKEQLICARGGISESTRKRTIGGG